MLRVYLNVDGRPTTTMSGMTREKIRKLQDTFQQQTRAKSWKLPFSLFFSIFFILLSLFHFTLIESIRMWKYEKLTVKRSRKNEKGSENRGKFRIAARKKNTNAIFTRCDGDDETFSCCSADDKFFSLLGRSEPFSACKRRKKCEEISATNEERAREWGWNC